MKVSDAMRRAAERLWAQRRVNAERLKDAPPPAVTRQQLRAADRAGAKMVLSQRKRAHAKEPGGMAAIR